MARKATAIEARSRLEQRSWFLDCRLGMPAWRPMHNTKAPSVGCGSRELGRMLRRWRRWLRHVDHENVGYVDPLLGPIILDRQLAAPLVRTRTTDTVTAGGREYFGTVQGGCDYQFAAVGNQFVIGAFGDYDFAGLDGNHSPPGTPFVANEKLSSQWSVGGRIGWVVLSPCTNLFGPR
jgi:hypothetical protein